MPARDAVTALLRPAVAADSPDLVELLCLQMTEHAIPFSQENITAAVARTFEVPASGCFLVAEENGSGAVIGVAYIAFLHSMEHAATIAWLEELYVRAEHRGRGIGSALLERTLEEFSIARRLPLELEVDGSHRAVESFYEKHGFTRRDRTRWLYRPPSRQESAS